MGLPACPAAEQVVGARGEVQSDESCEPYHHSSKQDQVNRPFRGNGSRFHASTHWFLHLILGGVLSILGGQPDARSDPGYIHYVDVHSHYDNPGPHPRRTPPGDWPAWVCT